MGRMTKTSKQNLTVADTCGFSAAAPGVLVWVSRNGNRAFLHDSESPLVYPTEALARRAIRRVRPDLQPSTI
ncbi:hypothetical protein LCGC14_0393450 [marine sediment metagenome]|uniref:Uncharacterized protein n=3 Tax=root TaxID=1 RepID=A0A7V1BLA4_9GAMM|nr:hypothetical protein [Marinobacter antarcticus]HDZ55298.1 hypothetical protein [Halopseudomonas xinjiangensis]HEA51686.1 hypothetical protein [Marinobacter antarcticus]